HILGASETRVTLNSYEELDPAKAATGGSPWMDNFNHIVWGHLQELGFSIGTVRKWAILNLLHQIMDPAYNPWATGFYHYPAKAQLPNAAAGTEAGWMTSWLQMMNAFVSTPLACPDGTTWTFATVNDWLHKGGVCEVFPNAIDHPYPGIARAAASFLPG